MSFSAEDKKGLWLFLVGILIVVTIGYLYANVKKKNQYDVDTLCPLEIPYEVTAIIIDKSDKWNSSEALKIKNLIENTSEHLQKYERLIVKVIEPDQNKNPIVKTYFDMCNPGKKANPFYENPRRVLKKYTKLFKEPLEKLMDIFLDDAKCNKTPLLGVIKDTLLEFSKQKMNFILISDLLEFSDDYDFYRHIPSSHKAIQKLHIPIQNISSIKLEYILRNRLKEKIYSAINFYTSIAKNANAKLEKHKLMTVY